MSRRALCILASLTIFTALSVLAAPVQAGDAALRRLKVGEAGKHLPGKPWLHEAVDGIQTLAVLIETVDAHEFHAGPNRRFMAVTKRLSQSP